jgi:hypothetical protein
MLVSKIEREETHRTGTCRLFFMPSMFDIGRVMDLILCFGNTCLHRPSLTYLFVIRNTSVKHLTPHLAVLIVCLHLSTSGVICCLFLSVGAGGWTGVAYGATCINPYLKLMNDGVGLILDVNDWLRSSLYLFFSLSYTTTICLLNDGIYLLCIVWSWLLERGL